MARLALAPTDRGARIVELSLKLEKAIERAGFTAFTAKEQPEVKAAAAAGPSLLIEAMKTAIADGKTDLAAVLAGALGSVIDERALVASGCSIGSLTLFTVPAGGCNSRRPGRREGGG